MATVLAGVTPHLLKLKLPHVLLARIFKIHSLISKAVEQIELLSVTKKPLYRLMTLLVDASSFQGYPGSHQRLHVVLLCCLSGIFTKSEGIRCPSLTQGERLIEIPGPSLHRISDHWEMSFNSTSILTQSLQLSDQLHTLLLTLCEDLPHKRLSLESILEACEAHQRESAPLPANVYIKKMVQFAVGSVSEVSTTLILIIFFSLLRDVSSNVGYR